MSIKLNVDKFYKFDFFTIYKIFSYKTSMSCNTVFFHLIFNKLFIKTSKKAKSLRKRLSHVSYEKTGNELIGRLKFQNELEINKPTFNFSNPTIIENIEFSNPNLILLDKGRTAGEHSLILIENDILLGFCFVDLEYQINHTEVLKSLITELPNDKKNRYIVKNYLQKYKVEKIIRY